MKWYAVQTDSHDDWGTGSFNKAEAVQMMMENENYTQIAVVENDVCIEEIKKADF